MSSAKRTDVAVAVQGGRAAMQRGSKLIRPVKVSIRIGDPIETAGHTLEERDELIADDISLGPNGLLEKPARLQVSDQPMGGRQG